MTSYELERTFELYGNQKYLSHKLKGTTEAEDRYLFSERVANYGIINFGSINANQSKSFNLLENNIKSDILLRSIYDFNLSATGDEILFKLYLQGILILVQKIKNDEMPFYFPDGAIVNPNITIEVEPRYNTTQLLVYWQPVNVIYYKEAT